MEIKDIVFIMLKFDFNLVEITHSYLRQIDIYFAAFASIAVLRFAVWGYPKVLTAFRI